MISQKTMIARKATEPHPLPLEEIKEAVEKIKYGSVQLLIQDGKVIQIDLTEKKRLV